MENEQKLWEIFALSGDPQVYRLYKAVKGKR